MSNSHDQRRRPLALAVAAVCGLALSATAMAAVPARAQPQFVQLAHATQLDRGALVRGPVALGETLHVVLPLKLRDASGLRAYVSRPHAPMPRAQVARHLPSQADAQAVADWLSRAGFTNVKIGRDRLVVTADGKAAVVQAAFKTQLARVHTADGRLAFANTAPISIPAALAGSVQAVLGLQDVHIARTYSHVEPYRAHGSLTYHFPTEFPSIYNANGLAPATSMQAGVWGWGSMADSVSDLSAFSARYGLSPGTVTVVCVDASGHASIGDPSCGSSDTSGTVEWSMDSQAITAMAGGLKGLTFYASADPSSASLTYTLSEIVTPTAGETVPNVVNASFGLCERYVDSGQGGDGSAQAQDELFQLGAAQGITFTVSTGDSGADNCGDRAKDSASAPASSPWVVAVAGTTLRASATAWARENLWNLSGGSPSSFEQAQPWQAAVQYGAYAGMRGPDVAYDANPATGMVVSTNGGLYVVGGTSLSAPLFAGAWARILQGNPGLGFAAPHLYDMPASVFHDITSGNNRGWVARPGWDYASGLGSMDVGAAAEALGDSAPL